VSLLAAVLAAALGLATPPPAPDGWRVGAEAHVDLWYHAIAVIGLRSPGGLALYDPAYRGRIAREKERRGVGPTRLDREGADFAAAFEADEAFEVLHFLPLYFASADRSTMTDAVRAAAGVVPMSRVEARARPGAELISEVLMEPAQRKRLLDFVELLDAEWNEFYGAYWRQAGPQRDLRVAAIQRSWDGLTRDVAPYLDRAHLDGGTLLVVEALAGEGRVLTGDPGDRRDNLVAVGGRPAESPEVSTLRAVREICFPGVETALAAAGMAPASKAEAATVGSMTAVRCGDLLLVEYRPDLRESYRRTALADWGFPPDPARLEAVFPLDRRVEDALRTAVRR
jgi:hypothetical protein